MGVSDVYILIIVFLRADVVLPYTEIFSGNRGVGRGRYDNKKIWRNANPLGYIDIF